MSADKAAGLACPLAPAITAATSGTEPELMGVAPIGAIRKVLDMDKLNPHGGAIAPGHWFGMTGARNMTTLLNDLETLGTIGFEKVCAAQGAGPGDAR